MIYVLYIIEMFNKLIDYPELEGTQRNHPAQYLAPHKIQTLCLGLLSKYSLNFNSLRP